jgi:hypothetical protein
MSKIVTIDDTGTIDAFDKAKLLEPGDVLKIFGKCWGSPHVVTSTVISDYIIQTYDPKHNRWHMLTVLKCHADYDKYYKGSNSGLVHIHVMEFSQRVIMSLGAWIKHVKHA